MAREERGASKLIREVSRHAGLLAGAGAVLARTLSTACEKSVKAAAGLRSRRAPAKIPAVSEDAVEAAARASVPEAPGAGPALEEPVIEEAADVTPGDADADAGSGTGQEGSEEEVR